MKDNIRAGLILSATIAAFLQAWSMVTPLPSPHFLECTAKVAHSFGKESYTRDLRQACGDIMDPGADLLTAVWNMVTP